MRDAGARFVLWVVLLCFATFAAFPFVWMLITSFKETRDLLDPNHNPFLYHSPPTMENCPSLLTSSMLVNTASVFGS